MNIIFNEVRVQYEGNWIEAIALPVLHSPLGRLCNKWALHVLILLKMGSMFTVSKCGII